MPPDLVAALVLHPQERRDQARVAPVGGRVEDEVRAPQPVIVLEPCEVECPVETLVDVVAKAYDGSSGVDGGCEVAQRHHAKSLQVRELVQQARVALVRERPLGNREEQAFRIQ